MKKHKKEHHEEHMDESWLVPYADILTLLLALFIVLFATSQTDKSKLEQMENVFNAIIQGQTGIMNQMSPFQKVKPDDGQTSTQAPPKLGPEEGKGERAAQEETDLIQLKNEIEEFSRVNNLPGFLSTSITGEGLVISIKSASIFAMGGTEVLPEARHIPAEIAEMLQGYNQKVTVAGHTDDVPSFRVSNWEISTQRAINFLKLMLENNKLDPARFNATGYGEYRPIVPNITDNNRQINRRVEILVHRNF
jgi:chemotaxis protein MotB